MQRVGVSPSGTFLVCWPLKTCAHSASDNLGAVAQQWDARANKPARARTTKVSEKFKRRRTGWSDDHSSWLPLGQAKAGAAAADHPSRDWRQMRLASPPTAANSKILAQHSRAHLRQRARTRKTSRSMLATRPIFSFYSTSRLLMHMVAFIWRWSDAWPAGDSAGAPGCRASGRDTFACGEARACDTSLVQVGVAAAAGWPLCVRCLSYATTTSCKLRATIKRIQAEKVNRVADKSSRGELSESTRRLIFTYLVDATKISQE